MSLQHIYHPFQHHLHCFHTTLNLFKFDFYTRTPDLTIPKTPFQHARQVTRFSCSSSRNTHLRHNLLTYSQDESATIPKPSVAYHGRCLPPSEISHTKLSWAVLYRSSTTLSVTRHVRQQSLSTPTARTTVEGYELSLLGKRRSMRVFRRGLSLCALSHKPRSRVSNSSRLWT